MLDVRKIKSDFPIFKNNPGLIYLDSAATSLKPKQVIDKLIEHYENYSANVKRGIYKISEKATEEYEKSRKKIAGFINVDSREIIFTRGTTESINLIAYSLGRNIVEERDEIVTTIMEHHSNFVPWQQLALNNGAFFKVMDISDEAELPIEKLDQVITKKTKILALTYVSNVLGTINPVKEIVKAAKKINPKIFVVIDAAQAVPHMEVDVQELGCDFLAFSGHKMLGPTGVGVLWGRFQLLNEMFPFQYGGEMIEKVRIEETKFAPPPDKFEAGTPAIGDVIALGEAVRYIERVGIKNIRAHEKEITSYAIKHLSQEFKRDIKIYGPVNKDRGGAVSFSLANVHPHDLATVLDEGEVCVRAGHHCTMPLHKRLGVAATARLSPYLYNSPKDIDRLIEGLKKGVSLLSK